MILLRKGIRKYLKKQTWEGNYAFFVSGWLKFSVCWNFSYLPYFSKAIHLGNSLQNLFAILHFSFYIWILYFLFCQIKLITFCKLLPNNYFKEIFKNKHSLHSLELLCDKLNTILWWAYIIEAYMLIHTILWMKRNFKRKKYRTYFQSLLEI